MLICQVKKEIAEFDSQTVAVRIYSNVGESEFSREIGRERGEEVAGYLRHLGLKNKIVISKRSANPSPNNLSSQQKSNQPLIIELYIAFLNLVRYIFKSARFDIKASCVLQLPEKSYKTLIDN